MILCQKTFTTQEAAWKGLRRNEYLYLDGSCKAGPFVNLFGISLSCVEHGRVISGDLLEVLTSETSYYERITVTELWKSRNKSVWLLSIIFSYSFLIFQNCEISCSIVVDVPGIVDESFMNDQKIWSWIIILTAHGNIKCFNGKDFRHALPSLKSQELTWLMEGNFSWWCLHVWTLLKKYPLFTNQWH